MEKELDKVTKKRLNILNDNLADSLKDEREKNRISLRKKKIQNYIMKKRYIENLSNIDYNLNNKNSNTRNNKINDEFMIDISSFSIKEELKKKSTIDGILLENNLDTIFNYINEIYKENNFNIDNLKYGLFLLNEKLLRYSRERKLNDIENIKLIDDLVKLNIKDIIIKLLAFSTNEINSKSNENLILNLAYQILVNYSYFSNESQMLFLLSDNCIKFHIFFLRFCSEEQNIVNILRMINNLIYNNIKNIDKFITYNNNEFINILNDYFTSAIKSEKNNIYDKILDIYLCYIQSIENDIKENSKNVNINVSIIKEIYLCTLQSIFLKNKSAFSNSLYIIGTIYKILFKTNNLKFLSDLIIEIDETKSMVIYILDYNYISSAEDIIDFCNIISYILKCESYINDIKIKKLLEKFIKDINRNNLNGNEIIVIVTNLLRNNFTKKIFSKLIDVLISLCDSETFYLTLFESLSNPILILINNIDCKDYKIKKKVLVALGKLCEKQQLKIGNELAKNQIFNKIKYAIDPNDAYCRDDSIIILCLDIIKNMLIIGDFIKDMGGSNVHLEDFENHGGKEMIERFLDNKNKEIYEKAFEIYKEYFNKKDE